MFSLDLLTEPESWKQQQEPEMNQARSVHSSTTLGDQTFVFCGFDGELNLSSMEVLDFGPKPPNVVRAWQLIHS